MANDSRKLTFYCPTHLIRFQASGEAVIQCEQGSHAVGYGFPDASWWEFCCDCGTFWPSGSGAGHLRSSDCMVCERRITRRYLCARCQVVSCESGSLVRRKTYSIDSSSGIGPNCPGCAQPSVEVQEHSCSEVGGSLLTSRSVCPFCESSLRQVVSEAPVAPAVTFCPFCGTEQRSNNKFCKRCGKPQGTGVDAKRDQEVAARIDAEAARRLEEENRRLLEAKERKRAEEEQLRLDQARRRDLEEQQRIAEETRRRAEEQLRVEAETRRLAEQERLRTEEERRRTEIEAEVEREEPSIAEQAFSLAALQEERVSAQEVPNQEEQKETSVDSLDDTLDPDTPVSEEVGTVVVEDPPVDSAALVIPVPTETDPRDEVSSLSSTPQELPETDEGVAYAPSWKYLPPITTKSRTRVIAIVVVLSALLLVGVFALRGNRGATGGSTQKPPSTPVAPAGTVYIPGGEFEMGTNAGDDYEKPAHKVTVNPFFMDIREVTCEDYLKFISATGHKSVANGANRTCSTGPTQTPATGVDWNDAIAYAQWAKKRLPTEEEWEFAARGSDGRRFPWGNEWKGTAANIGSVKNGLVEVGSYPEGKSPAGVMDLIGNAWEWTSTDLKPYPNGQLPRPPRDKDKVIRGGSWKEDKTQATSTYRGFLLASGEKDYSATGIRCVQDVPPQR